MQCDLCEHCVNRILPQNGDWRLILWKGRYCVARIDVWGFVHDPRLPDQYEMNSNEWRLYTWENPTPIKNLSESPEQSGIKAV